MLILCGYLLPSVFATNSCNIDGDFQFALSNTKLKLIFHIKQEKSILSKTYKKYIMWLVCVECLLSVDSERSDECILILQWCVCFFFVSVYSITSRNNASISNFGGGFRWLSEYPWCIIEVKSKYFQENREKQKKVTENGNFYAKLFITQKLITITEIFRLYTLFLLL
ncbi:Uncharacterized protein FWK35_00010826 [Aphis craccivora]|uniref:Uncharacterized protein n=1 Tax=Aphis craccivora TaxID=307492 RepID=A0A6G0YY20_APHCR|nr:Uncharacterized protein FWK35_00010826 [Aphis craccivora]